MSKLEVDMDLPAFVFLIVMFWGNPDLCDALIHWLMK